MGTVVLSLISTVALSRTLDFMKVVRRQVTSQQIKCHLPLNVPHFSELPTLPWTPSEPPMIRRKPSESPEIQSSVSLIEFSSAAFLFSLRLNVKRQELVVPVAASHVSQWNGVEGTGS